VRGNQLSMYLKHEYLNSFRSPHVYIDFFSLSFTFLGVVHVGLSSSLPYFAWDLNACSCCCLKYRSFVIMCVLNSFTLMLKNVVTRFFLANKRNMIF